jgi:hypothetical protein
VRAVSSPLSHRGKSGRLAASHDCSTKTRFIAQTPLLACKEIEKGEKEHVDGGLSTPKTVADNEAGNVVKVVTRAYENGSLVSNFIVFGCHLTNPSTLSIPISLPEGESPYCLNGQRADVAVQLLNDALWLISHCGISSRCTPDTNLRCSGDTFLMLSPWSFRKWIVWLRLRLFCS